MEAQQEEPKRLTIEKLRTFKGLSHLTDDQARQVTDTLEQLADLLIRHRAKRLKSDNYEEFGSL